MNDLTQCTIPSTYAYCIFFFVLSFHMIQDDNYGIVLNKGKRKKKGERRREKGLGVKELYLAKTSML